MLAMDKSLLRFFRRSRRLSTLRGVERIGTEVPYFLFILMLKRKFYKIRNENRRGRYFSAQKIITLIKSDVSRKIGRTVGAILIRCPQLKTAPICAENQHPRGGGAADGAERGLPTALRKNRNEASTKMPTVCMPFVGFNVE